MSLALFWYPFKSFIQTALAKNYFIFIVHVFLLQRNDAIVPGMVERVGHGVGLLYTHSGQYDLQYTWSFTLNSSSLNEPVYQNSSQCTETSVLKHQSKEEDVELKRISIWSSNTLSRTSSRSAYMNTFHLVITVQLQPHSHQFPVCCHCLTLMKNAACLDHHNITILFFSTSYQMTPKCWLSMINVVLVNT